MHGAFRSASFISLMLLFLLSSEDDCKEVNWPPEEEEEEEVERGVDKKDSSIFDSFGLSGQRGSISTSPINITVSYIKIDLSYATSM